MKHWLQGRFVHI